MKRCFFFLVLVLISIKNFNIYVYKMYGIYKYVNILCIYKIYCIYRKNIYSDFLKLGCNLIF